MLGLLRFLIVDNHQKLAEVISKLEPFPDLPEFAGLRSVHNKLKYATGSFALSRVRTSLVRWCCLLGAPAAGDAIRQASFSKEVAHFLSVTSCDCVLLTGLEGLKQLTRQLHDNRGQIGELLRACHSKIGENELRWKMKAHALICCARSRACRQRAGPAGRPPAPAL